MKNLALGIVAAIGLTTAAQAADMAVKARPAPVVVYSWTGCYIGGNIGGGWHRVSQERVALANGTQIIPPDNFGSGDGSSFVGGGQIGCDFQFGGNWVAGVQVQGDWADSSESHANPSVFAGGITGFRDTSKLKATVTVTGRLGYLFSPQVLGYVKGGGAWARMDYVNFQPNGNLSETALDFDHQGWTVGAGLEWMFAPGWSVFGEFNYMDFDRRNVTFVAAPGTVGSPSVLRTRLEVEQFLVGINYKFNFGGPVVAKY